MSDVASVAQIMELGKFYMEVTAMASGIKINVALNSKSAHFVKIAHQKSCHALTINSKYKIPKYAYQAP